MFHDITARKPVRVKLRDSKTRKRAILPAGIWCNIKRPERAGREGRFETPTMRLELEIAVDDV